MSEQSLSALQGDYKQEMEVPAGKRDAIPCEELARLARSLQCILTEETGI